MDAEDEAEETAATADGGMIVGDDGAANNIARKACSIQLNPVLKQ
jgi:hypothetical protein